MDALGLGFIGSGKIAFSIASTLLRKGLVPPSQIWASAPTMANLNRMESMGIHVTNSNATVLQNCNLVMLCVKARQVVAALAGLENQWKPGQLLISVIPGVSIAALYKSIPHAVKVVRVLPNLAVLVEAGVFSYCVPPDLEHRDVNAKRVIRYLFEDLGTCQELTEELLDTAFGLCASGPAFVFSMILGLSDGGVKMGLPRHISTDLAAQTVMGSAKLVLETGRHPDLLREEVCSPSGTTIYGCHALENRNMRSAFTKAVEIATKSTVVTSKSKSSKSFRKASLN